MAIGKSLEETKDDEGINKDFFGFMQMLGKTSGRSKETSFIVVILNREFNCTCREKNHSLSHKNYIIERQYSKMKCTIREESEIGEKPKHLRQNQIQLCWYCRAGRNSLFHYYFAHELVLMKTSQESFSPNFLWRWKQAHVVSSRGAAYLWDKIQVNLKILGLQILSSENLGRN